MYDDDDDSPIPLNQRAATPESRGKEYLPSLVDASTYELEAFIPVTEADSDKDTTVADLAMLNNNLAVLNAALPEIRTIDSLCKIASTTAKLIETRRKVKKLDYGPKNDGSNKRTFEVIE